MFLFGMRTLSDAIRRMSATSFREFLSSITQSTWVGTVTGLFVTSLIQSSSAVTVTLVSLVNAGLLTIREAVGVLLGANIGTTITAWLIVLSLGGFSLSDMALPIAGLAVPMLLMERRVPRQIANMMLGFALLFIGLNLLKGQMEIIGAQELFTAIFPDGAGIGNNVLFLLIGATLTALIQSSSAATALTLAAMPGSAMSWVENSPVDWPPRSVLKTITSRTSSAGTGGGGTGGWPDACSHAPSPDESPDASS